MFYYEIPKEQNEETFDIQTLVIGFQGLINREGPILFVDGSEGGSANRWINKFREKGKWLENEDIVKIGGLNELVDRFRAKIKGAVIWDEEVNSTYNIATTIAGIEDGIIIGPSLIEKLGEWRIPIVTDLRKNFNGSGVIYETSIKSTGSKKCDAYIWAVEKYLKRGLCNDSLMGFCEDGYGRKRPSTEHGDTYHYISPRDYLIQNKAFVFDLSPWSDEVPVDDDQEVGVDYRTFELILKSISEQNKSKKVVEVIGFAPWWHKYCNYKDSGSEKGWRTPSEAEWMSVKLFSRYNCYINAGLGWDLNMSFHSHYRIKTRLKQDRPENNLKIENKTYLCVLMNDYDGAGCLYGKIPDIWEDKTRGTLPLAWGINPNNVMFYPDIIEYLYETKTKNDYFVADASGAGYLNPSQLSNEGLGLWAEHCQKYYEMLDYDVSGMVLDWCKKDAVGDEVKPKKKVLECYGKFSPTGFATAIHEENFYDTTNLEERGRRIFRLFDSFLYNGMPVINLYSGEGASSQERAKRINNFCKELPKDRPQFMYFSVTWRSPEEVKEIVEILRRDWPKKNYELVHPFIFFNLLRQFLKAKTS